MAFMNPSKLYYLKLLNNICIVLLIAVATSFLLAANYLDYLFFSGDLINAFKGKNVTISSQEGYYLLCFFRKASVFSWSILLGDNLDYHFTMLNFTGLGVPGSIIYKGIQNDIRQLATATLVLTGLIIWGMPWGINRNIITQKTLNQYQNILSRIGILVLWGALIYLRNNYSELTVGDSSLPAFVSLASSSNQEFWLLLLFSGIEFIFIGIFPVSILFIKKRGLFLFLAIGICMGGLGATLLLPTFGEILCNGYIEAGISPFR